MASFAVVPTHRDVGEPVGGAFPMRDLRRAGPANAGTTEEGNPFWLRW